MENAEARSWTSRWCAVGIACRCDLVKRHQHWRIGQQWQRALKPIEESHLQGWQADVITHTTAHLEELEEMHS